MDEEGLFIPLQVSLDTLRDSLDKAYTEIGNSIKIIETEFSNMGENTKLESLNTQLQEGARGLNTVEQGINGVRESLDKTDPSPVDGLNKKFKETQTTTDKLAKGFEKFFGVDINNILSKVGLSLDKITKMITSPGGILIALSMIGKQLLNVGKEFDEAFSDIAKRTGLTGEKLEEFDGSLVKLGETGIEQSFAEIGGALAEINIRMGLTGKEAENMTKTFADFADVTGQNVLATVQSVSPLMEKWNIKIEDTGELLDKLTKAGQLSGMSVGALTNQLTTAAAQFQAAGFSIDESIALLTAFEKSGVRTENVITGLNKAVAYFGERGIEASRGIDALISNIQKATTETEAMKIATEVFGTRSGVEFVNAIRSGKFALDDYVKSIKDAAGTVENTDKASQTLGDRLSILGNQIKAKFEPMGKILVGVSNTLLDILIPALGGASDNTAKLSQAEGELKENTTLLKKAVNDYEAANKELNDTTKTLNETEKKTIQNRKEIASLEKSMTLTSTIQALEKIDKVYLKSGESIEGYQAKIKNVRDTISNLTKEQEILIDAQSKGIKWISLHGGASESVTKAIEWNTSALKTNKESLVQNEDALSNLQLTMAKDVKSRRESITTLAEMINSGAIALSQITARSDAIAKEVEIRAQQIMIEKQVTDYAEKYAAGTLTEIELNKLANKESITKIKSLAEEIKLKNEANAQNEKSILISKDEIKTNDEKNRLNKENEKRLMTDKIDLLNWEWQEEIANAEKIGADTSLIDTYYAQQIYNERQKIEKSNTSESLITKLQALENEKMIALTNAKAVNQDILAIEKYYNQLIIAEKQRMQDEIVAQAQIAISELSISNASYNDYVVNEMLNQAKAEIEIASQKGEDLGAVTEYWNNQIMIAQMNLNKGKIADNEKTNTVIENQTKILSQKMITDADKILSGAVKLIAKFDKQTAETIEKIGGLVLDVAKIAESGGKDIGAWIDAVLKGIDLIIDGLKALAHWWDVNINKIDKMTEYAKYKFKEMRQAFQKEIGDSFAEAFEEGIDEKELEKIIGRKILRVAIDAAIFSAGIQDKLDAIGSKVSDAIKNGFDPATLDSIKQDVKDIYDTTNTILQPLAENINESFGLLEEEVVEPQIENLAEKVTSVWEEAINRFTESAGDIFTNAFVEGFDLEELRKRIGEQLLQVAVESALLTIGFQDKMEQLGALVSSAINSGFTQESLDAISSMVNSIYEQAATVISPIAGLIGSTFGTGAKENFGTPAIAETKNITEERKTGLVVNQNLNFNVPVETPIETKRLTEQATRDALYESGLTA